MRRHTHQNNDLYQDHKGYCNCNHNYNYRCSHNHSSYLK